MPSSRLSRPCRLKRKVPDEQADALTAVEDVVEAVEELDLSRRHVLSELGQTQTAQRWYEGSSWPQVALHENRRWQSVLDLWFLHSARRQPQNNVWCVCKPLEPG